MKILITMMIAVLTFSVGAQEEAKPIPPVRKAPSAGTEGKGNTTSKNHAATKKTTSSRAGYVPPSNRWRVSPPSSQAHAVPRARPPVRRMISSNTGVLPGADVPKVLTENVIIHLEGAVSERTNLDLSLTGIGPIFQADVVTGDTHTILSHTYSVRPNGSGYAVEYNIGLRIRMEVARNQQSSNYEFRDVKLSGTVLIKEGAKVVISKNGDKELCLTVSKAP